EWNRPSPAIRFQNIPAGPENRYAVVLNSQEPELSSVSARLLPINPDEPLSLWIKPGEKVEVRVALEGRRALGVSDIRGAHVGFDADGRHYDKPAELEA